MKEIGSKIAVLIIVLVMLFLANLLFEATNTQIFDSEEEFTGPLLYEDVLRKMAEGGKQAPTFEDYEVLEEISTTTPKDIRFETAPLARSFQELIDKNYTAIGANFAGHFSLVTWSCGLDCQNSVIIDTNTGTIVYYGLISKAGLSFSRSSKLLINNVGEGTLSTSSSPMATDYYVLTDDAGLKLVAKVVDGEDLLEGCINATTTARNFLTNEILIYTTPCHVPYGWEIIAN